MEQQPSNTQPSETKAAAPASAEPAPPVADSGAPAPAAIGSAAGDTTPVAEAPALVTIDQFGALELRVALVRGYERVAGTDRLLKLDVDLGSERRTIVSGIAHLIEPESLVGLRIIVVANLQPARIRGVESRGMLLAAGGRAPGEAFGLATVPDTVAPGTRVS